MKTSCTPAASAATGDTMPWDDRFQPPPPSYYDDPSVEEQERIASLCPFCDLGPEEDHSDCKENQL